MRYGIRLVQHMGGPVAARDETEELPAGGAYLREYSPDSHDGRGHAVWTLDPNRALRFPSIDEAMAFWRQQSTVRPLRDDGEPNRPLTAFTVTVVSL